MPQRQQKHLLPHPTTPTAQKIKRTQIPSLFVVASSLVYALYTGHAYAAEDLPTVALLPARAGVGSSVKEAAGVLEILRETIDQSDYLLMRKERRDDEKTIAQCFNKKEKQKDKAIDAKCLADAAFQRAAGWGSTAVVYGDEGNLEIYLYAVKARDPASFVIKHAPVISLPVGDGRESSEDALRRVTDLLLRRSFAPSSVVGELLVTGLPEGATVFVDDEERGVLPLDESISGVLEGEHTVRVSMDGFWDDERKVQINFAELTAFSVSLTAKPVAVKDGKLVPDPSKEALVPWGPIALGSVGGAGIATGLVLGTLAALDSAEVERRAAAQQLFFPRDAELVRRGSALALGANIAYLIGVSAGAAAGAWWFFTLPPDETKP